MNIIDKFTYINYYVLLQENNFPLYTHTVINNSYQKLMQVIYVITVLRIAFSDGALEARLLKCTTLYKAGDSAWV